jgi:hypothetical protein
MMLGRLAGAYGIWHAARENHTPVSIGDAYLKANRMQRNEVDALILAYVEAEDGVDPTADPNVPSVANSANAKPATVESYVKRVDALGEALSTLLAGDFPTPKAETLEALKRQAEALSMIARNHETLTAMVANVGKSPAEAGTRKGKGKAVKAA